MVTHTQIVTVMGLLPYHDVMTPIRERVRARIKRLSRAVETPFEDEDLKRLAGDLRGHRAIGPYGFTHPANERKGRAARNQAWLKGQNNGAPDILIFVPFNYGGRQYIGNAIELKRGYPAKHRKSKEQIAFIQHLRLLGWRADFCEGYDEAIEQIRTFYGPA